MSSGIASRKLAPVSFVKELFAAFGFFIACFGGPLLAQERPNILFIAVDDLNHWVGHLGRNPQIKTPNLDRLAQLGTSFSNAHCAAPVCNASRAALLSGKRPSTTGIYDNGQPYEQAIRPEESIFSVFKAVGYETIGMGKLWHGGIGGRSQWSLSGPKEVGVKATVEKRDIGGIQFGVLNGGDEAISDTSTANFAIEQLSRQHAEPFFLAIGFHKPHMPWNVPQKYLDLYPLSKIELPPHREDDLNDVPPGGIKMAKPTQDHAAVVASGRWKEAIQAYMATISYLDGQVGRVLDAYDRSPEKDNTIIVLWGDHGWHLGEKSHWRKFALWEEATRAPLIWVVPGVTKPGTICQAPVDFMSIYPTLAELSNVPRPAWVEGESLLPLLKDVSASWENVALTTYGRSNHAVRSSRWRYIRYADGGEELYDHEVDQYEWTNLAQDSRWTTTKVELAGKLPTKNAPTVKKPEVDKANKRNE
jgi:arylsulfatase A-like enzyme